MNATRRRALALAAGMGAAAALAVYVRPSREPAGNAQRLDLDRMFPAQFGPWQVDRVAAAFIRAADRQGRQTRLYDQVLERTFVNAQGERIMLSVAYGAEQSSDMQLHRPEVCYRAGGFDVRGRRDAVLQIGTRSLAVTHLLAVMPGRPEPITYWSVIGGEAVAHAGSSLLQRLALTARRQRADGLLIRLSSIDPDTERAHSLHGEFASALVLALAPADRARVIGAAPPV